MNFKQMEYFVEVCRTMNFTKAAENLYVSQTAITKQIHLLEEELGTELFDRTRKKIRLTVSGKYFLGEAESLLQHHALVKSNTEAFINGKRGVLKVGFIKHLNSNRLIRCMMNFRTYYPDITCELYAYPNDVLYQKLDSGELDCILGITPESDRYSTFFIKEYPLAVLMKKDDPLANSKTVDEKELGSEVLFDMRNYRNKSFDDFEGVLLRIACYGGYAVVYSYLINNSYKDYLEAVPLDSEESIGIGLVYDPNNYPMVIKSFIETLEKEFIDSQMSLPG